MWLCKTITRTTPTKRADAVALFIYRSSFENILNRLTYLTDPSSFLNVHLRA